MVNQVVREDVQRLISDGAQVLDPLGEKEFLEEHLPGAINIPQHELTREAVGQLNKESPVIVYCYDTE